VGPWSALLIVLHYIFTHTFISFFAVLFCFAKKERKKGAPKTMTAVFGWFFEELLCKEVNSSGAVVSAFDVAAS
jgi:membrane-bound metal-dependent hydrolase YbcI (DUF457 family)